IFPSSVVTPLWFIENHDRLRGGVDTGLGPVYGDSHDKRQPQLHGAAHPTATPAPGHDPAGARQEAGGHRHHRLDVGEGPRPCQPPAPSGALPGALPRHANPVRGRGGPTQAGGGMKLALSCAEAAEQLGVSEWTVRRLVRDGKLPSLRIERRVLIPATGLALWVE